LRRAKLFRIVEKRMAVSKGVQVLKYLVFIFNLLFWLSGIALIVVGAIGLVGNQTFERYAGQGAQGAAILLIVVGCIVFVLGFLGCFGAIRENFCLLVTFAILLALIFILELAAGIACYVLRNKVEGVIYKGLATRISELTKPLKNSTEESVLDKIQRDLHCCGSSNYTDWALSPYYLKENRVPVSCCRDPKNRDCAKVDLSKFAPPEKKAEGKKPEEKPSAPKPTESEAKPTGKSARAKREDEPQKGAETTEKPKDEKPDEKKAGTTEEPKKDEGKPDEKKAKATEEPKKDEGKHEGPIWNEGCAPKFFQLLKKNIAMLAGVGVGIACLQLVGIILSSCLAHSIRRGSYETV